MERWPQTINGIFLRNWDTRAHVVSDHTRIDGRWVPRTHAEGADAAEKVGMGLRALGVQKGTPVAILAGTRKEWVLFDVACLGLGGITVGLYPTSTGEQSAYCIQHSGAKVLVVENPTLLAALELHLPTLTELAVVVMIEGRAPSLPSLKCVTLDELMAMGEQARAREPGLFRRLSEAVAPDDPATYIYTSGTTGPPKGAILTHGNFYQVVHSVQQVLPTEEGQVGVAFLPLAHALQRFATYQAANWGFSGYFAPGLDKVTETLQEVKPNTMGAVPRILEKMYTRVMATVAQMPARRQRLFHYALSVGRRRAERLEAGQPVPWLLQKQFELFDRIVFKKIKAVLGGRIERLVSGGAPLEPEIARFFLSIGILVLEGYGLTETCAPATLNVPDAFRFGTVGRALPGTEISIAPDGEVLIRGPGVFKGYFKNPEATRDAFTEDGWFKSGDIGRLEEGGFLKITDRKKDILITASGKNIAPQEIENKIKGIRWISNAAVFGDRRKYLCALLTLDVEELREHFKAAGRVMPEELRSDPEVRSLVEQAMAEVNTRLAQHESIKRFEILPGDFTTEGGELTPTLKLKRRVLEARYKDLIGAMYPPE